MQQWSTCDVMLALKRIYGNRFLEVVFRFATIVEKLQIFFSAKSSSIDRKCIFRIFTSSNSATVIDRFDDVSWDFHARDPQ